MNNKSIAHRSLATLAAFVFGVMWVSQSMAKSAAPITIDAIVGMGGPALNEQISWSVTKLDKSGVPGTKPIVTQTGPVLNTELKPGQYLVLGRATTMSAQMAMTVGENPIKRTLVFGMAQVNIRLITNRGRKPVKDPVEWELRTYEKGKPGGGEFVASQNGATAHFNVPAGGYVVRARYQGVRADLVLPLGAGQAYDYTVNLYAGNGRLSGWTGDKRLIQNIQWQVVREKSGANGDYVLVSEAQGDNPTLLLREGNYFVIGSYKNLWGMAPLAVIAGQTVKGRVQMREGLGKPNVTLAP